MPSPKTSSFLEAEKSMDVDVACQRVTGTGLDTLFCTGLVESTRVDQSRTFAGHCRGKGEYKRPFGEYKSFPHEL
jgi:hypothetical protein